MFWPDRELVSECVTCLYFFFFFVKEQTVTTCFAHCYYTNAVRFLEQGLKIDLFLERGIIFSRNSFLERRPNLGTRAAHTHPPEPGVRVAADFK